MKKTNNRFKNYALWTAIAALVGMIIGDIEAINIGPEKYQSYVDAVLYILIVAGVITNPSVGKGIKDKVKGSKK